MYEEIIGNYTLLVNPIKRVKNISVFEFESSLHCTERVLVLAHHDPGFNLIINWVEVYDKKILLYRETR